MTYHEPTKMRPGWTVTMHGNSYFARNVKHNSDTGPFSTYQQAYDFMWLRGQ